MPLFEYQCADCGKKFEELVLNSSQAVACPECNSENVSKQMSTFAASGGSSGSMLPSSSGGGCGSGFG